MKVCFVLLLHCLIIADIFKSLSTCARNYRNPWIIHRSTSSTLRDRQLHRSRCYLLPVNAATNLRFIASSHSSCHTGRGSALQATPPCCCVAVCWLYPSASMSAQLTTRARTHLFRVHLARLQHHSNRAVPVGVVKLLMRPLKRETYAHRPKSTRLLGHSTNTHTHTPIQPAGRWQHALPPYRTTLKMSCCPVCAKRRAKEQRVNLKCLTCQSWGKEYFTPEMCSALERLAVDPTPWWIEEFRTWQQNFMLRSSVRCTGCGRNPAVAYGTRTPACVSLQGWCKFRFQC